MSREFIQKPFIAIPPALFQGGNGLNAAAIAVWCALARWTDKDGKCWRPIRLLAKDIEQSEATVQRAISTLKKKGWIKVTLHKGAHSEYRLIWGGSNAMSMQSTGESDITLTSLDENTTSETAQHREKEEKRHHTDVTSDITLTSDLYVLSILSKEERERKDCAEEKNSALSPSSLFSNPQNQKSKQSDKQDKGQEQPVSSDSTLIEEPVAVRRHVSVDEQYQQEQERLTQQKKPEQEQEQDGWTCSYDGKSWHIGTDAKAWLEKHHHDVNLGFIVEQAEFQLQALNAPRIECGLSYLDTCCKHPFQTVAEWWEDSPEWINDFEACNAQEAFADSQERIFEENRAMKKTKRAAEKKREARKKQAAARGGKA